MYYREKRSELIAQISNIEKYINNIGDGLPDDLCNQSMVVLKDELARKYEGSSKRKLFTLDDLWNEPYNILSEYPVALSTTFHQQIV